MSRSCTPQSIASETSTLLPSRKPPAVRQYGGRVLAIIIGIYIWRMALAVLGNIASVSISQIREGVICRNFYDNVSDPPNDPRCKSSDVQAEFALVEGIELVFQLLPGIITAPFYGRLTDKYGRRPALFLTALGTLLTNAAQLAVYAFPHIFPVRSVWAAGLVAFIGGGDLLNIAWQMAMISDIMPESQRANSFFYYAASAIAGRLIGGPLCYYLMQQGDWFTAYCGLTLATLSIITPFFFPETNHFNRDAEPDSNGPEACRSSVLSEAIGAFRGTFKTLRTLCWNDKMLGLLICTSMFTALGNFVVRSALLQYLSKKFDYSWAEANLLTTLKTVSQIIALTIIFPILSEMILRRNISPIRKDMILARTGTIFSIVGFFGIALAYSSPVLILSFIVYGLNQAAEPSIRSLMVVIAAKHDTKETGSGSLFAVVNLFENVGLVLTGPLLAITFRWGLSLGDVWLGMPLMLSGALMVVVLVILFGVSVGRYSTTEYQALATED